MKLLSGDKWYYHPKHGADLKWRIDEKLHYKNGWFDSPDDFKVKDEVKVEEMDKEELEKFARDEFGVELDRRKTKVNMLKDLEAQIGE